MLNKKRAVRLQPVFLLLHNLLLLHHKVNKQNVNNQNHQGNGAQKLLTVHWDAQKDIALRLHKAQNATAQNGRQKAGNTADAVLDCHGVDIVLGFDIAVCNIKAILIDAGKA